MGDVVQAFFPALILIIILSACTLTTSTSPTSTPNSSAGSAPLADYGDAPDGSATGYPAPFAQVGHFPTRFSSNGARVLNVNVASLGSPGSAELDAIDPSDPDGVPNLTNADSDDGLTDLFLTLTSIPPATTLSVDVNAPAGSPGGIFYLNALIDLNMDGEWGGKGANGENEWVVQNESVRVEPGQSIPFTSPPFAFSNGNLLPDGAYMRIALTNTKVPNDWDGTGEFAAGEIEDYVIKLPEINGKKTPILRVDCGGPYKPGAKVTCTVTNLRANAAGNFTYDLKWLGGGTVNVPIATCIPPSPAAIAGGGTVAVTCNSTKGTTPTKWLFTAHVKDPDAQVVQGGIILGHSEASSTEFEFNNETKQPGVFVGDLQAAIMHHSGFSNIQVMAYVLGADPQPVPGATAQFTLTRPDGSMDNLSIVSDENGLATGKFTIYTYGEYSLSIDNVTADGFVYTPELNAASEMPVDVTSQETTFTAADSIQSFYQAFNQAFASGDAESLLRSLHPAVLEKYGVDACRNYLQSVLAKPVSVEVVGVTSFGEWDWQSDGSVLPVQNAFTIQINENVQGQSQQAETHLALRDDGSLGWFTDCGDPLP